MTEATASGNPVIQQALDTAHDIEKKINEFFNAVNEVLSSVPEEFAYLVGVIKNGMKQVREKV